MTATVLAFGAHLLGKEDVAVYDGSWSEWGADPATPKATGAARFARRANVRAAHPDADRGDSRLCADRLAQLRRPRRATRADAPRISRRTPLDRRTGLPSPPHFLPPSSGAGSPTTPPP